MARVRVQGEAGRSASSPLADCALSPSPRLVDVVRGVFPAATERMVHCAASAVAARGPCCPVALRSESLPRPRAALLARAVLPVLVYDSRRAPPDRPVVEPAARR